MCVRACVCVYVCVRARATNQPSTSINHPTTIHFVADVECTRVSHRRSVGMYGPDNDSSVPFAEVFPASYSDVQPDTDPNNSKLPFVEVVPLPSDVYFLESDRRYSPVGSTKTHDDQTQFTSSTAGETETGSTSDLPSYHSGTSYSLESKKSMFIANIFLPKEREGEDSSGQQVREVFLRAPGPLGDQYAQVSKAWKGDHLSVDPRGWKVRSGQRFQGTAHAEDQLGISDTEEEKWATIYLEEEMSETAEEEEKIPEAAEKGEEKPENTKIEEDKSGTVGKAEDKLEKAEKDGERPEFAEKTEKKPNTTDKEAGTPESAHKEDKQRTMYRREEPGVACEVEENEQENAVGKEERTETADKEHGRPLGATEDKDKPIATDRHSKEHRKNETADKKQLDNLGTAVKTESQDSGDSERRREVTESNAERGQREVTENTAERRQREVTDSNEKRGQREVTENIEERPDWKEGAKETPESAGEEHESGTVNRERDTDCDAREASKADDREKKKPEPKKRKSKKLILKKKKRLETDNKDEANILQTDSKEEEEMKDW